LGERVTTTISIEGDVLVVVVLGLDKLWSMKSQLDIPLEHVRGASIDPAIVQGPKGWRGPGSNLPGVITAGTFHQDGKRIFWDVHHGDNAVVIELQHDSFERLVVEVDDPYATVALIESALADRAGSADG
jgi:hypothetical protein